MRGYMIEYDFGNPVSPIKESQLQLCDTLLCLNVPYERSYGLTKTGQKTRIIKTAKAEIECYFMDKVKFNKKVMTVYEAKLNLIRMYIQ